MNKFLFELGTEEIPADMIGPALQQMRVQLEELLEKNRLSWESISPYSSPRRLAFLAEGLPSRQPQRQELVLGPPRSRAVDESGEPTKAAQGFARKLNVPVSALEVVETPRGAYMGYRRTLPGRAALEILAALLPELVTSISWPKGMYWRESRFRFIRPLRWFLALWNSKIVPFELEGVRSGRITRGHRFLGKPRIEVSDPDDYLPKLRGHYVLVDLGERRAKIQQELERETPPGLCVLSDPRLLETVSYLNEYPSVCAGRFSSRFLEMPCEVLITVMRHHQKYFAMVDEQGDLQPWFLTVLNTAADTTGAIRKGHERVLKARLEDASFFWQRDRKTPLRERVERLGEMVFQEELGTYLDKTRRLRALCRHLLDAPDLEQAAWLSKADLTTEMVFEMTELQGIMGGLYAKKEGYPEEVWKAIHEHYRPVSLEDETPSTRTGALLSIADKLDTIVGCFGINIIPTGSGDPFGLRRQAQGVVKVLFDHQLDFKLEELVERAQENFPAKRPVGQVKDEVLAFLCRRVERFFRDKGISYDVCNALLAVGIDRVYDAYLRAVALSQVKAEADFEALAIAFKRVKNILANQSVPLLPVREEDLVEEAEVELSRAYRQLRAAVEDHVQRAEYSAALKQIASMRGVVDRFFDEVLVMTEETRLRNNRLRLLADISQLFLRIADISEIVRREQDREG